MVLSLLTELANLNSWVSGKSPDLAWAPIKVQADRRLMKTWSSYQKHPVLQIASQVPTNKRWPTGLLWFTATQEKDLSPKLYRRSASDRKTYALYSEPSTLHTGCSLSPPKSSLTEYPVLTEGRPLAPHLSLSSGVGHISLYNCLHFQKEPHDHKSDIKVEFWETCFPKWELRLHIREFRIKDLEHESQILRKPTPPHTSTRLLKWKIQYNKIIRTSAILSSFEPSPGKSAFLFGS